jgi:hypothetical protein
VFSGDTGLFSRRPGILLGRRRKREAEKRRKEEEEKVKRRSTSLKINEVGRLFTFQF